jgi:hypothetical protein
MRSTNSRPNIELLKVRKSRTLYGNRTHSRIEKLGWNKNHALLLLLGKLGWQILLVRNARERSVMLMNRKGLKKSTELLIKRHGMRSVKEKENIHSPCKIHIYLFLETRVSQVVQTRKSQLRGLERRPRFQQTYHLDLDCYQMIY